MLCSFSFHVVQGGYLLQDSANLLYEHDTWGQLDMVIKPVKPLDGDKKDNGNNIRVNTGKKTDTRPDLMLCNGHTYEVDIYSSRHSATSLLLSPEANMYLEANYMAR